MSQARSNAGRRSIRSETANLGIRIEKADNERLGDIAKMFLNMSKNQFVVELIFEGLEARMRRVEREIHPANLAEACKLAAQCGWHVTEEGEIRSPGKRRVEPEKDESGRNEFRFAGFRIPVASFIGYLNFGTDALTKGICYLNGEEDDEWPDNIGLASSQSASTSSP